MGGGQKRRREENGNSDGSKKQAQKKVVWQQDHADSLTPFVVGVFVTCVRGKERIASHDTLSLFNDYAERHDLAALSQGIENEAQRDASQDAKQDEDIESSIAKELGSLQQVKKPAESALFTPLKTDTECVLFFKTAKFIDPVTLVHDICQEAYDNPTNKLGGRFIRRLTPISVSADAKLTGLQFCLDKALPRAFLSVNADETVAPVKYRIEPTFRNHNSLNRDIVIPEIAAAISKLGPHKVDLTKFDVLVLVEVIRGFIGISVVRDWNKLKRFNLDEIYTSANPETVALAASKQ